MKPASCTGALFAILALGAATLPALAASSASSAISDSLSTSVDSFSNSVGKSSKSSKGKDVAQGDYRVIEVAAAEDRSDGAVRVRLQAVADAGPTGELELTLPRAAVERGHLGAGAIVTASTRPYGVEFATGAPREAFFLALHDDWYRELKTRPVVL